MAGICYRCGGDGIEVLRDHYGQAIRRLACTKCHGTGRFPPPADRRPR